MNNITNLFFRDTLANLLPKNFCFTVMASASLLASTLTFTAKADAQTPTVNNNEIVSYAQAVLAMEPSRQQAFSEIKKLIGGGEIPQIVCNDPKSINNLPRKARNIAINYCNRSQKIVEENGLTIEQFNKITIEIQNDDNLKRQIYNTLIRLQKK
ncbi:DUF4168 domain-containing protein [Nostoc sp. FACHB-87]|uniref:DUF4168 domain-containing protein n=1 Tax=Nostocales TaxID=1161 RepID=UPI001686160B|nr:MULTISPECIES: DUF4168 domain-containing protein [Nostocales]MBD2300856.1 DUF4168 domain-containing protein [Nostoc sp. FACHB-190]MBD2455107.1 DUF4168 domain-containing protein [Nostoc sp. FACHB-87]MBD2477886.1 DUF4168 domain-containing protein [Anabaena sp. FACHB-83]MBD2487298.1 DUF4168 domain-containing protein [Aulosira sp. FACHB-615]